MEGNKSQPRAILVFGAPCSGKTTFCDKFCHRFKIPFLNFTEMMAEYDFTFDQCLVALDLLTQTGRDIVIEGGLDSEADRRYLRRVLKNAGYATSLIWVQTDITTIKFRLKSRFKSAAKAKSTYDHQTSVIEAPAERENPIVISGKHTFKTQLSHVLARLA